MNNRKKEWEEKSGIKVNVSQEHKPKSRLKTILSEISENIEDSYEKKYIEKEFKKFIGKEPGE